MPDVTAVYQLLVQCLLVDRVLFLVGGIAVLSLWRSPERRRRFKLVMISLALGGLLVVSCPPVAHLAMGSLEWSYSNLAMPITDKPDAIVVLGGYVHPGKEGRLGRDSTERSLKALEIYRSHGPCTIVICGGQMHPDAMAAGTAMRNFLVRLGVADSAIVVDQRSTTTYENVLYAIPELQRLEAKRVVLVTTACHLMRADLCFRKLGYHVQAIGADRRAVYCDLSPIHWLPSPGSLEDVRYAQYEWMGIAWYWAKGRI